MGSVVADLGSEELLAGAVAAAEVGPGGGGDEGRLVVSSYISMWPFESEKRAREIGAAFHAAMYGLQLLHIAVPSQREKS